MRTRLQVKKLLGVYPQKDLYTRTIIWADQASKISKQNPNRIDKCRKRIKMIKLMKKIQAFLVEGKNYF